MIEVIEIHPGGRVEKTLAMDDETSLYIQPGHGGYVGNFVWVEINRYIFEEKSYFIALVAPRPGPNQIDDAIRSLQKEDEDMKARTIN